MGSSTWSDDFYNDRASARKKAGTDAFAHHAAVTSGAVKEATHPKMNPKDIVRESRDSAAHPNSVAIGVMLDVTGSMHNTPRIIQELLPKLNNELAPILPDKHILFGAIGDAKCDRGPLQVGQFEAGIEQDDDITRMFLEGNGGGNLGESYELAIYWFARHTSIDCFEKRQKKGYLFIIGDEPPHPVVEPIEVQELIGAKIEPIRTEDIVKECQEKYHVFYLVPDGTSHSRDGHVLTRWENLLGKENVIHFTASNVVQVITRQVGLCEGKVKKTDAPAAGVQML
jgi:hypothetical protein